MAAWKSAAYRRLKPIWKCTPAASTAARAASSSSSPSPAGFSQKTCFPAAAAWAISEEWKRAGLAMITASISGSARMSAASAVTLPAPRTEASAAADSTLGSAMAASSAPGTRRAMLSAWKAPIQPEPMSPIRTGRATSEGLRFR